MAAAAAPPGSTAGAVPSEAATELRTLLDGRYGSLPAAFAVFDCHSLGRLTSDGFTKGLQRLGYGGQDAAMIFRELDADHAGLLSLRAFLRGLGEAEGVVDDVGTALPPTAGCSEDSQVGGGQRMTASRSLDALSQSGAAVWSSAHVVRLGSDSQLAQALPRGRRLRGVVGGSPASSSGSAAAVASSEALDDSRASLADVADRLSRVEEHMASAETSVQGPGALSAAALGAAEQLDALRQQLECERQQRLAEVTSLRASLELSRSESQKAAADGEAALRRLAESLASELSADLHERAGRQAADAQAALAAADVEAAARLDCLRAELLGRVEAAVGLEATHVVQAQVRASVDGDLEELAALRTTVDELRAQQRSCEEVAAETRAAGAEQLASALAALREELRSELDCRVGCVAADARRALDETARVAAVASLASAVPPPTAPALGGRDAETVAKALEPRLAALEGLVGGLQADIAAMGSATRFEPLRTEVDRQRVETARLVQDLHQGLSAAATEQAEGLGQLREELTKLADEGLRTQRALAALREQGAAAGLGAPATAAGELADRVAALEQRPAAGGAVAGALAQLEDRVAAADLGLARVCGELRDHGCALDEVRAQHRTLSEDVQDRLQVLIDKVDGQCQQQRSEQGLPPTGSHHSLASGSTSVGGSRELAPRLLGFQASLSAPAKVQPLAMPRSQSCGELYTPREEQEGPDAEQTTVLQALREENLRLREANLEIRESVQAKGTLLSKAHPQKIVAVQTPLQVASKVSVPLVSTALPVRMASVPHTLGLRQGTVTLAQPVMRPPVVVRGRP